MCPQEGPSLGAGRSFWFTFLVPTGLEPFPLLSASLAGCSHSFYKLGASLWCLSRQQGFA